MSTIIPDGSSALDDEIRSVAYRIDNDVAREDLLAIADRVEEIGMSMRGAVVDARLAMDIFAAVVRQSSEPMWIEADAVRAVQKMHLQVTVYPSASGYVLEVSP